MTTLLLIALTAYIWRKAQKFNRINLEIYRKAAMLTVLFMITISGYSQRQFYINLDWPRTNVKYQNRDLEIIYSGKNCIEYKTETGYIGYEFADRICIASYICIDSTEADSLIRSHSCDWLQTAPNQWVYKAGYDEPVKVTADWMGETVIFRYEL